MYLGGAGDEFDQRMFCESSQRTCKIVFKKERLKVAQWVEDLWAPSLTLQSAGKSECSSRCVHSAGVVEEENVDGGGLSADTESLEVSQYSRPSHVHT